MSSNIEMLEHMQEEQQRVMPEQKPGRSKQTYGTPQAFIDAVEKRFGKLICDLAASKENAKCEAFFDEAANALVQPWAELYPDVNLWLNPPYKNIGDWAKKCAEESVKRRGLIILLVPASISTCWFADHVHRKAMVLGISPRLVFNGEKSSFPKDLMIAIYGNGFQGFDTWRWTK